MTALGTVNASFLHPRHKLWVPQVPLLGPGIARTMHTKQELNATLSAVKDPDKITAAAGLMFANSANRANPANSANSANPANPASVLSCKS